ncbi:52 kDa repressor of the inhibitor of the protein kinase-like [Cydia splendana]|uniref:52 kDa repressor of the inhibitor of the protein kinase-like n=1 Tax=Cydia splendana TaxID=1100963 RepID=UPI00213A94BC
MASKPKSRTNPYKRYCSVYGCLNKRKNSEAEMTFFKIPDDIERRQEWLAAIDREDLLDEKKLKKAKKNFVCSAHFDDSAIITSTLKRLKSDAAPTKLLPDKSQKNIPPDATKKDKILVSTYSHNQSQTDPQELKGIESETNALQSHKKVRILSNEIIKIEKPELTCTSMQTDLIETSNKMTQTTLDLSDQPPRKRKLKKELVTVKCQRKRLEQELQEVLKIEKELEAKHASLLSSPEDEVPSSMI